MSNGKFQTVCDFWQDNNCLYGGTAEINPSAEQQGQCKAFEPFYDEEESTKQLIRRINHSKTYDESFNICLELLQRIGMSKSFMESVGDKRTCSYEEGMFIAKAFDTYNLIPKMNWLPDKIIAMYRP